MTFARLFQLVNFLAMTFGWALIIIGVLTINISPSEKATYNLNPAVSGAGIATGLATIFVVKRKTILRRVIAGFLNVAVYSGGTAMLFTQDNNLYRPVIVVLGGFLTIACGLGVAASLLPTPHPPHPDIIKRRKPDTTE